MSEQVMRVKRALRPLIPDRVMARYRLREHSRASRTNVDVAISDPAEARRWLRATPDTYRIVDPVGLGPPTDDYLTIPEGADAPVAARMLSRPDIAAAMVGEVATPRLVGRRHAEPLVAPTAILVRPGVLDDVGGVPAGDQPLPGLLARLSDAGYRVGLVPGPPSGVGSARRDPIAADPIVIFAAVPIHDVGGGSRGAQLALELVNRGYHVTYVYLFPSYEHVDLGLRYIHPALEQVRFDRFDAAGYLARTSRGNGIAILEAPAPHYVGAVSDLHRAGWDFLYDVIDDWSDPALGGDWYDAGLEAYFVSTADTVVASAPTLVDRAGAGAVLVPNGVNSALFSVGETPRPSDLPEGTLIGYHGSLYGDWFDWDALSGVATHNPEATVVLIGEARGVREGLPSNVAFLGLKAQQDLPSYVSRFEVGLVPFVVTPTTHAVSPLKVYEYLASGVPVAAPPLRALDGLSGVHTDEDLPAAVAAALDAPRPDADEALRLHSWSNRLDTMFSALGRPLSDPTDEVVRIVCRPAVHYPRRERRASAAARNPA